MNQEESWMHVDVTDGASTPPAKAQKNSPPPAPNEKTAFAGYTAASAATTSISAAAASAAAKSIAAAAPLVPTLNVKLQYDSVPLGKETKMKALITATPPVMEKPKEAWVVICLDESYSMDGQPMNLLRNFMQDLFKRGVPGVNLHVRILMYGTDVVDKKIGDKELTELNDDTRDNFLALAAEMKAKQGSTNISSPVLDAIQILKRHRANESREDPEAYTPPTSHIVLLTDGQANQGITNGGELCSEVRKQIEGEPIFCHYIGLGGNVNEKYLTQATDVGKTGVYEAAPDGSKLSTAFEVIFGLALETRFCFDVKMDDGNEIITSLLLS